ncbi:MAG: ATP phosphoribosyltransferase regulatory subunit [Thermoanaerobacterales bacterium 50_218]|nr:MAG: ATP phosphoribosyltransferase regulatory subunit [Thermoanaerobacterales bacterium 50_218]HAA90729.1 ATP phosphoribosyltransferase regulatory subunit [Peptococcaceae bacterium]
MEDWGTVLMPGGVRDLLPGEARQKRELENSLLKLFRSWGYQEVVTPTFEFYEVLAPALEEMLHEQLYRFIDEEGRVIVLRPDMTTPIARLVSTRLRTEDFPLRFCYVANVFRRENHAGKQREFYQAGVELIGAAGAEADAEILGLMGEAFRLAGIKDFQITIGQVEVLKGLLEGCGFGNEEQEKAKTILNKKDFVAWEKLISDHRFSGEQREVLENLPHLQGGIEILDQVEGFLQSEDALAGLSRLRFVWEILTDYGLEDHVSFDLGFLRGLGYYTGIIFEGYAPGVGYPLCGGGRYDRLLEKFGFSCPATGFAINIERFLLAMKEEKIQVTPAMRVADYFIVGENFGEVAKKARQLREQGFVVEIEVSGRSPEEAVAYAAKKGVPHILVM